jgi:hypothetical protein
LQDVAQQCPGVGIARIVLEQSAEQRFGVAEVAGLLNTASLIKSFQRCWHEVISWMG